MAPNTSSWAYDILQQYAPTYFTDIDAKTANVGCLLFQGMDPLVAANISLLDHAIGSGGTTVNVNGVAVSNPNFNHATPAALAGFANLTWRVSGSNVSAYSDLTAVPNQTIGDGSGQSIAFQTGTGQISISGTAGSWAVGNSLVLTGDTTSIQLGPVGSGMLVSDQATDILDLTDTSLVFMDSVGDTLSILSATGLIQGNATKEVAFTAAGQATIQIGNSSGAAYFLIDSGVDVNIQTDTIGETLKLTAGSGGMTVTDPTGSVWGGATGGAEGSGTINAKGLFINGVPVGTMVPSKTFYVDGARTDTYTANGTIAFPFKTIMAAVNQIITNADNSTHQYVIKVQPATYAETIDLGNTALYNLTIDGGGFGNAAYASIGQTFPGAIVNPSSGNALQGLSNLTNLTSLTFNGFTLSKPVVFTDTGNTFGTAGFILSNCAINANVTLSAGNSGVMNVAFISTSIKPTHTMSCTNTSINWIDSDMNAGTFNLTSAGGQVAVMELVSWAFNPAQLNLGAGSFIVAQDGINLGGTTVTVNGTLILDNAIILANVVVNSGGTFQNNMGTVVGSITVNAGGTHTVAGNNSITESDFFNAGTGYRLNNAAPSGHYLRGNGTNYVDSTIQAGDISGLVTWNTIANPTGNQNLSMGQNSTTWHWGSSFSSAETMWDTNGNLFLQDASAGGVANSPMFTIAGLFQAGFLTSPVVFAYDDWVFQDIVGAGYEGTSTLSISQSGSTGVCTVQIPALVSTATSTSPFITMTQTAADNFQRANENPMSDGGNWSAVGGGTSNAGQLVSNLWEATVVATAGLACWTGNGGNFNSADQYSEVTLATATVVSNQIGPCVRCSTTANTQYRLSISGTLGNGTSTFTLFKIVAGAATTLIAATTRTFSTNDKVRLAVQGSNLYCYQNGTLFATATDASIATGTPGMIVFQSTGAITNGQLSGWSGGTVVAVTTNATGNITLQQPTPALVNIAKSSPILTFSGQYWNGAASAADTWTIQNIIGTGTNGTSALTVSHAGSATATPLFLLGSGVQLGFVNNVVQLICNTNVSLTNFFEFSTGLCAYAGPSGATNNNWIWGNGYTGFQIPLNAMYAWSSSTNSFSGSNDTALSRVSAGTIAVGNSAQGDTTGNLQLNHISKYNAETTAGVGTSYIRGVTSQKSETGADASVLSVTPASAAGTYRVSIVMSVSAANTVTALGWTATWTDSNGHAQAPTNLALTKAGTAAPALTFAAVANDAYYGEAIIDVNNAGTAIVVKTTFTGTSIAYLVSAVVERLN